MKGAFILKLIVCFFYALKNHKAFYGFPGSWMLVLIYIPAAYYQSKNYPLKEAYRIITKQGFIYSLLIYQLPGPQLFYRTHAQRYKNYESAGRHKSVTSCFPRQLPERI